MLDAHLHLHVHVHTVIGTVAQEAVYL